MHGCNFIKNKEYKCILGKSMPPYTNLSFFNNQLQKLDLRPKHLNKKCSNRGICQENVPGFLELVSVLINYGITILSTLILKLFCYFPFNISPLMKIIFCNYCLAN